MLLDEKFDKMILYACIGYLCRIVDNMPITWCYDVENNQKYCSRGFPIGCYVTKEGKRKDTCVISVSHRYVI